MKECTSGRVTIPTDVDVVPETLDLVKRWGADAIRDCDGTDYPEELKNVEQKYILLIIQPEKTTQGKGKSGRDSADVYYDSFLYSSGRGVIHSSDEPSVSGYAEGQ